MKRSALVAALFALAQPCAGSGGRPRHPGSPGFVTTSPLVPLACDGVAGGPCIPGAVVLTAADRMAWIRDGQLERIALRDEIDIRMGSIKEQA